MKIIIKSETDDKTVKIEFSNDELDNLNFISMYVDEKEYLVSLLELELIVEAFKRHKEHFLMG